MNVRKNYFHENTLAFFHTVYCYQKTNNTPATIATFKSQFSASEYKYPIIINLLAFEPSLSP